MKQNFTGQVLKALLCSSMGRTWHCQGYGVEFPLGPPILKTFEFMVLYGRFGKRRPAHGMGYVKPNKHIFLIIFDYYFGDSFPLTRFCPSFLFSRARHVPAAASPPAGRVQRGGRGGGQRGDGGEEDEPGEGIPSEPGQGLPDRTPSGGLHQARTGPERHQRLGFRPHCG